MLRVPTPFLLAGGLIITGCVLVQEEPGGNVYDYVAYDSTGEAVVNGILLLRFEEPEPGKSYKFRIRGRWTFESVGDDTTGQNVWEGNLLGSVTQDGRVGINLHPQWVDSNLLLNGHFVDEPFGSIEGRWALSQIYGTAENGTFRAVN